MGSGEDQLDCNWFLMKEDTTLGSGEDQLDCNWFLMKEDTTVGSGEDQLDCNWFLMKEDTTVGRGEDQLDCNWFLMEDTTVGSGARCVIRKIDRFVNLLKPILFFHLKFLFCFCKVALDLSRKNSGQIRCLVVKALGS